MKLLLITGQSGAGKTKAMAYLEDMGYYCVDNLPPAMISTLLKHISKDPSIEKISVVVDVRGKSFFSDLGKSLTSLDEQGIDYEIVFLEASQKTLLKRYQETRRVHPLALDGNTEAAIRFEVDLLSEVRKKADYVINTTNMKTADLYSEMQRRIGKGKGQQFRISVSSFGFKYGLPAETDWIMDVRFVPNPFYVESLKNLTGKNKKVKDFVLSFEETQKFVKRMADTVAELVPSYIREGKYHLDIAIGCTGGKHRSVVITEELGRILVEKGLSVETGHRELTKK